MSDNSEKDFIFNAIKRRMKTWIVAGSIKQEELVIIASKQEKAMAEVTFWDFLSYSYGIDDSIPIQALLYLLAFESSVVSPTNQYVIKLISLLSDIEGGKETELTDLQKLLKNQKIDASSLIRG